MRARLCSALLLAVFAYGQTPTPAKPEPDTLTLTSGEKLIGHFVRSTSDKVLFHSDGLGDVALAWGSIKELHTTQKYVVLNKQVKLTRHSDVSSLPNGTVTETDQTLFVEHAPGVPPQKIPVPEAAYVVDEDTFHTSLMHSPGFFEAWKGAITGGASIVEATQQARTFTGGVALVRALPVENWLSPRNRTLIDFSASDGFITQPDTPKIKTEIYHADAERDQYFRGKDLYGFAAASFDHNFSQGLDLQTNLGGGLGYTVIKKNNETLDFKGSVTYIKQDFQTRENDHSLLGSNFIETYSYKTAHGILFLQQITLTPTWTELDDYSGSASGSVAIPVFKRIGFTTAISDNYLNNPPPGFKKNSFQLTTGLTYTLK